MRTNHEIKLITKEGRGLLHQEDVLLWTRITLEIFRHTGEPAKYYLADFFTFSGALCIFDQKSFLVVVTSVMGIKMQLAPVWRALGPWGLYFLVLILNFSFSRLPILPIAMVTRRHLRSHEVGAQVSCLQRVQYHTL